MPTETLGIIIHGATSGIANRQHFPNALMPIIAEGGLKVGARTILPKLLLVGRDEGRLRETAGRYGLADWTTDLDVALADKAYPVFFDAGVTGKRPAVLRQ